MKWIFKYEYKEVEVLPSLGEIMQLIYMSLFSGMSPEMSIKLKVIKICIGGDFIPDDGQTTYKLTPLEVFNRNRDNRIECLNLLSGFFGGGGNAPIDKGIVGRWTKDLDNHAKLYYVILNGIIHKMFIQEYNEFHLCNITGKQYIMEINGMMMDMVPEEGDIMYDSYEEAKKYLKRNE